MKDIVLLLRQRKGIYLSLLCITGIVTVLAVLFFQNEGAMPGDAYACVAILMLWMISIVAFLVKPKSEKEFFESLPVKRIAVELYPYVGFLVIFAINILLAVVASKIDGGARSGIAGLAQEEFISLCLTLLATGTMLFLCIEICKDPVWGVGIGFGGWFVIVGAAGFFEKGFVSLPISMGTVILAVAVAGMVLLMVLHAHYRELSGGKICFFRALDVVAMIVIAGMIFSLIYLVSKSVMWSLLALISVVAVIYHEVFYKKRALKKVEIRVHAQKKNPWFSHELPVCLETMGVLLLVILGTGVRAHMELIGELTELLNTVGTEEASTTLNEMALFWHNLLPVFVIGILSIYGMLRYITQSKKEVREFLEMLPVSRKKRYTTMVTMDLLLVAIPLFCNILLWTGYYWCDRKKYDVALLAPMKEAVIRSLGVFCLAVAVLGILYLVDAVTVSEIKAFNYSIVMMIISLPLSGVEGWFQDRFAQSAMSWLYIASLMIGIVLIVLSGRLYVRRDNSREYFYYKPAMHVFAILYAATFAFFVLTLTQHILWYVVAVVGAIVIYWGGIRACSQPKVSNGEKKVLKIST